MVSQIYTKRFGILLASQMLILFGALFFPPEFYENYISPVLFVFNVLAGLFLMYYRKKLRNILFGLLCIIIVMTVVAKYVSELKRVVQVLEFTTYFTLYITLTREIIIQVWNEKKVTNHTLMGLVSGFINLGFIGFFICLNIEIWHPHSFQIPENGISLVENLMYYSYITLLTIGYGDITPLTPLAHKAAIFIGTMGQLYLVILTGIMIGKYSK